MNSLMKALIEMNILKKMKIWKILELIMKIKKIV